jgi:hypothetical protein
MFFASVCLCLAVLNIVSVVTFWTCYGKMVNILLLEKSSHQYIWHETAHIFFKLFSFFKLNMWQNLLYCNGEQQRLAVRQPAKPLMSQFLLCQCLRVKRDRPPEPSHAFERKRQIALSGRVWKSRETRQHYIRPAFTGGPAVSSWGVSLQRQSDSTAYSDGVFHGECAVDTERVFSWWDSERPADKNEGVFSRQDSEHPADSEGVSSWQDTKWIARDSTAHKWDSVWCSGVQVIMAQWRWIASVHPDCIVPCEWSTVFKTSVRARSLENCMQE